MSKRSHEEYINALDHWMLCIERDMLETRVKRLLTARNKWRKRARVAEARIDRIVEQHRAELAKITEQI